MPQFVERFATIDGDRWVHMGGWGGGCVVWLCGLAVWSGCVVWLCGLATMALFVVLIAWVARSTTANLAPPPGGAADRAREILAERHACGELSTDEYSERVEQLR